MKTRTRKTTRVLCASAVAMMTLLSSAAPAFAVREDPKINLDVKDNSITFDKKIYADDGENAPDVNIKYKVEPRKVEDVTETEKKALAESGYDTVVTGKEGLTAADTTFTKDDTLVNGQDYFLRTSTIDASELLDGLTKPTVFTYTLTEEVQGDQQKGFLPAAKGDTRKLNIYVGYKDATAEASNTLSVLYATLADKDGNKSVGFENNYDTQAIHLTKKVTGNQGDKTKKFTFTVNIANQYSKVTANGVTTNLDTTKLAPVDHNVSFTVDLANDETLNLTGLSKGATYTVTENKGTYDQAVTVDGKTPETTLTSARTISDSADDVVFTNTKEGTIPTGIYLNHKLPFNIAGIAILGGAISLVAKKRHDALEEDDDE